MAPSYHHHLSIKLIWDGQQTQETARNSLTHVPSATVAVQLAWATGKPLEKAFTSPAYLSLSLPLSQRLTLLSLSVVSWWFASTHCHPSVRPWPIKLQPAPISVLQLCWLFLDSIPPLISSSEISLHGSRGLVVGCWELDGWGGVGQGRKQQNDVKRSDESFWIVWLLWQCTGCCTDRCMKHR